MTLPLSKRQTMIKSLRRVQDSDGNCEQTQNLKCVDGQHSKGPYFYDAACIEKSEVFACPSYLLSTLFQLIIVIITSINQVSYALVEGFIWLIFISNAHHTGLNSSFSIPLSSSLSLVSLHHVVGVWRMFEVKTYVTSSKYLCHHVTWVDLMVSCMCHSSVCMELATSPPCIL